ncbi:MAG: di-heme oxidoredictase family protein [Pseudomonadota bacterium]
MKLRLLTMAVSLAAVVAGLTLLYWFADREPTPLPWRDDLSLEDRQRVNDALETPTDPAELQPFERMSGGAGTAAGVFGGNAFSLPAANLSLQGQQDFAVGNGVFRKIWVSSPASTQASDGLGPLFNARSCQRCHLKDGRGHPPTHAEDDATSLLLRVALPSTDADREAIRSGKILTRTDPTYGGQVQDVAVPGVASEGRVRVSYREEQVELGGGDIVSLRTPTFELGDLGYGPLAEGATLSARVAPPMIGLGLLEAIHEGDIERLADPDDKDGDGISGRVQRVLDPSTGAWVMGRFGWKATAPTLAAQTADAFLNDMGISSVRHPAAFGECTPRQRDCLQAPSGVQAELGPFEVSDEMLSLVVFYSSNLAVPPRRDADDSLVLRGKALFHEAGCAACHQPNYVTRRDAPQAEHQFQMIWPYTDLLLHDMGDALGSNGQVGRADGNEWRTPPLWGIGLTETVSGHNQLLHDGRARGLLEAIIWHGGEAQASRDRVVAMAADEREALLAFLRSL